MSKLLQKWTAEALAMLDTDALRFLHEDRQLMFDVMDNLHLGVMVFDVTPKPIFVNQTLADLLKLPVKSILQGDLRHSDFHFQIGASRGKIFAMCLAGESYIGRAEMRASDGEQIPIRVRIFPLTNKQDQIVGVIGVFTDLRQQLQLERFEQEYRHLLDAINLALVAVDANHIITTCNQTAGEFIGLDPNTIIGKPLETMMDDKKIPCNFLLQAIKHNKPIYSEVPYEISGKTHLFSVDCTPLKDNVGNVTGAVFLGKDVTLQRFIEEQINQTDKLAVLGQLIAGTAHEIKNPLTSVHGFIQLLKNRFQQNAPEQDYLMIMLEELNRANDIINNFLLLARPQNPRLELQDINFLLEDLLKLVEGQAILADVELVREFCADPPLMVMETGAIKQVFLNLLQNAIQAMTSGGKLTVETYYHTSDNQVCIKLTDTGIGIPQHLLANLGKPFFTTRKGGTGLGLMVSYKIIENHRGIITVDSQENVGTTFTIKLPVVAS